MDIKPIETIYKGYRFRSRLEARWAVFFDSLGIKWEYEPEGIEFDDGTRYLPDFYLPDSNQFFEVKGVMSDTDMQKVRALIAAGYSVTIGYDGGRFRTCDLWEDDETGQMSFSLASEGCSVLMQCDACGKYWFLGYEGFYKCQCCGAYDGDHHFKRCVMDDNDLSAWDVAKQARFEHGEVPAWL